MLIYAAVALGFAVSHEPAPTDILLMGALLFACLRARFRLSRPSVAPLLALGTMLSGYAMALLRAEGLQDALRHQSVTVYLVAAWLLIIGFLRQRGWNGLRSLMLAYLCGAMASVLLGLAGYTGIVEQIAGCPLVYEGTRMKGLFKDPNVFGPFLVPVMAYSSTNIQRSLLWTIPAVTCAIGVVLSMSRGAWLNAAVVVVIQLWSASRDRRLRISSLRTGLAIVSCLALSIAFYGWAKSSGSLETLAGRVGLRPYDQNRFAAQRHVLDEAAHSPIGIGSGQAPNVDRMSAHNTYLTTLREGGWAGFAGYTAFVVIVTRYSVNWARRQPSESGPAARAVMASIIGLLLNGLFVDTLHWRHFWIVAAFPLGLSDDRAFPRSGASSA